LRCYQAGAEDKQTHTTTIIRVWLANKTKPIAWTLQF